MNIKDYALSVTAVILIATVSDMLLSNGRMKNISRMVFSLIATLVFVSPIINFFKADISMDNLISENKYEIDENFLVYCNEVRIELVENEINNLLLENGITNAKVSCLINTEGGKNEIKNIIINLSDSVIIENYEHINNYEISQMVISELKVEEGRVTVIG